MATPTPFELEHRHHSRLVWISLGIIVLVGGIVLTELYIQRHPHTSTAKAKAVIIASPMSYSDIMGTVSKTGANDITVDATITNAKGQPQHITYLVSADNTTVIKEITDTAANDVTLSSITVGNEVQVAAATNIASVSHFTATKILKLSSH